MYHQQEDADQPEIHHVRDEDQQSRHEVMKRELVEAALAADEDVLEESPELFPELNGVVHLHGQCGLVEGPDVADAIGAVAVPAQPCGHETCWSEDQVPGNGGNSVIC